MNNWKHLSKKGLFLAMVGLFALCSANAFGASVIYIPDQYPTIQQGIDAAVAGDTVMVRNGTYPQSVALDFKGKAITVASEHGAANCILDGQQKTRVVYFHSNEGSGSVLSGFTIQNGQADNGGGIQCNNSSPTITDCTITNNKAATSGGGIYCYGSWAIIENCNVTGNTALSSFGGGICCDNASPSITNCIVSRNTASSQGGGIYGNAYNGSKILNCTIINNSTSGSYPRGGGMYFNNSSPTIVNCVIYGNTAQIGAGIKCDSSSSVTLTNCTIFRNTASGGGGGMDIYYSSAKIGNSIFWQNGPNELTASGAGGYTVTYSDVFGGYSGTGNINKDPLFVNIAAGPDPHLTSASPCIDAGDNTAPALPATDRDGNPRINNSKVDMGAYEYQSVPSSVVYVDFGSLGLWKYYGGWTNLTAASPDKMVVNGSKLLAAFPGKGLWLYDGATWTQLASSAVENMVAASGKVYVDFGSLGLWQYDNGWTELTAANPDKMQAFGNRLVVSFPGYGLYEYDGLDWTLLSSYDGAEDIVGADLP